MKYKWILKKHWGKKCQNWKNFSMVQIPELTLHCCSLGQQWYVWPESPQTLHYTHYGCPHYCLVSSLPWLYRASHFHSDWQPLQSMLLPTVQRHEDNFVFDNLSKLDFSYFFSVFHLFLICYWKIYRGNLCSYQL